MVATVLNEYIQSWSLYIENCSEFLATLRPQITDIHYYQDILYYFIQ